MWPPNVGDDGQVARRWPPRPSYLIYTRSAVSASPCSISFVSPLSQQQQSTCRRAPPLHTTCALAGVGRSGHHRSPPAATPRPEHRLHLVHPALTSVSRGKAPFNKNRSLEHGRAHRRAPLHGLPSPLHLFPSFCAHFIRLGSPVLERHSPCRLLAGDGWPPLSRAAVLPLAIVSLLPSLFSCVSGSAESVSRRRV
jgi:hypothetical protein